MTKRNPPRGSNRPPSDSGSGRKPPSKKDEKAGLRTDTNNRIEEAIAVLDFRLHLDYLNMASAVGGGDFEEFKRSWLMNYYNAMTEPRFKDKPKSPPSKTERPRLLKTNDELMMNRQIKSDNLSSRENLAEFRRSRDLLPFDSDNIG
ncbi:hypothetical protein B9T16_25510 [Arthrospira sp. PCC 8006]|uniref:hypothetical protein n=1 Tax=Arthrospira sp. PCC 8006 TaxID=1982224 RepID=UPI00396DA4B2